MSARRNDEVTAVIERAGRAKRVHIRADIDRRFRAALMDAARAKGGKHAVWHISNALENGPSRRGLDEMMKYFGWTDLKHPDLVLTAAIVDGLEITLPGFKRWLELTGFGNDKTMVKGFIAWAQYQNGQGHMIGSAKKVFEQ